MTFRSHIDGAMVELTPERAIEVQILLGSDIAMQLDECVQLAGRQAEIERAMQLSLRWAERCKRAFEGAPPGRALFGIVQGGDDQGLRERKRARARSTSAFDGYAIGGLAVGEAPEVMRKVVARDRAGAAGGAAALSHGRRHAGGPSGRGRARHRHVRLRACRRATAATVLPSPASARSISRMRTMPTIRGRSMPRAAVRRRAIFRAPTCITFLRPAKRSAVRCCRSSICSTTRT